MASFTSARPLSVIPERDSVASNSGSVGSGGWEWPPPALNSPPTADRWSEYEQQQQQQQHVWERRENDDVEATMVLSFEPDLELGRPFTIDAEGRILDADELRRNHRRHRVIGPSGTLDPRREGANLVIWSDR